MKIEVGKDRWLQACAFWLRMEVFVKEQGISLKDEFDRFDTDQTTYVVVFEDKNIIATGRIQKDSAEILRPERICIHPDYRGKSLGSAVLNKLEDIGRAEGCEKSIIHALVSAVKFYEKQGYKIVSDKYIEDGCECISLEKKI